MHDLGRVYLPSHDSNLEQKRMDGIAILPKPCSKDPSLNQL